MINCVGVPIPNLPRDRFWLEETTIDDFVPCKLCCGKVNRFPIADGPTNPLGRTVFANPVCAGGYTDPAGGERIRVNTAWGPLPSPPFDIQFNSPDLSGDLTVDLSDVVIFAGIYYGPYEYRADYVWDGAITLSDIVVMANAIGAACADDCP
jgi:hypothetical protein